MNAHPKHFGSPSGEPSITTTRPTPQQMCEKLWTLPAALNEVGVKSKQSRESDLDSEE